MKKIVVLFILIFGLVALPHVFAATYTVGSGGTYSTIQACANAANSGDICSIKAGTYNERVNVNKAGVSFVGETYRTATVNGGFILNVANTRIEDLRITTTSRVNAGVMLWEAADGTKIYDNYFFDVNANHAIWGPMGSTDTANNVHVKDNLFHRVQIGIHAVGNNWLIENNEIDSLYAWGPEGAQYSRFHGSNQIWRNNYWHGATKADTADGHVDCFQTWDQGNPHINNNVTIINNTCIDFHAFAMIQAQEGGGQINGLTIKNNIGYVRASSGYLDTAFALNIEDATNMVIDHNTFIGATWYSVYFNDIGSPDHPSGTMKNNLIMNAGTEAWSADGCNGDCVIKNNIWWNSLNPTPTPDSTNKNVNPQLTDIANFNFKPMAGSPACTGGEGGTYVGAIPCGNSTPSQGPDTNGDGCISISEISAYVSLWLNNGGVTLSQVSSGVSQWLAGCSIANNPPSVSLTSPTNGAAYTAGQSVVSSATAADSDGTITKVEFYRNGVLVNTDNSSPYSYPWTSTQGTYSIYARAYDDDGASTSSSTVNITVNPVVTTCTNGLTQSCITGQQGICSAGTQTCTNNAWGSCVRNNAPVTEVCTDNLDNDCDGALDCSDSNCASNPSCQSGNCTVTVSTRSALQTAINNAAAGAVICVAPGTYPASGGNQIEVNTAGITIKGQTRRTATIVDGFRVNAANVKIEGLRMTTSTMPWPSLVFLDTNADYAKIYDNYFYEVNGVVIRAETGNLGDASFVHVKDNLMYRVNWGIHASGENWIVENNEIDTLVKFINWLDNDYIVIWGNNHIFRNNYMHGTNENSIGDAHVNCFQTYDWTEGNPYTVHNILIENNMCFGFHEFARLQAWDGEHDNITIKNNIMVVFPDTGFLDPGALPVRHIVSESAPNVKIEHNTIIGANSDNLVSMEGTTTGTIKNNLIANGPTPYDAQYCQAAGCSVVVGYNMMWNYTNGPVPSSPTNIFQSTGFVDPIVTNNRSKWKPTNPVACTGGEGGTYIGAVPCN